MWSEDQWIMRRKNMIAINQFLQVLDSLNVEMNTTKFVLKVSRRDRFLRMVKNAQLHLQNGLLVCQSIRVHMDNT